jgi:predicted O-methyltransferase YrrM
MPIRTEIRRSTTRPTLISRLTRRGLKIIRSLPDRTLSAYHRRKISPFDAIYTFLTPDEKSTLYRLARRTHGQTFVEIGSYLGASSCCIAHALRHRRGTARLYCVDTWMNDGQSEGRRDTFEEFGRNTEAFRHVIVALRGESTDVASTFDRPIDFMFVDGDHSLEGVKGDWDAWSPHLAAGAMVIFHDIGWSEGVQKVVRESVEPRTGEKGELPNMWWAIFRG